jgi:hypothetical protein
MTDVAAARPLSASDSVMWRIEADPVLRSAVLVVGISHRDTRCPTVASDRAAITDPALLASCRAAAFHEVVAPAPGRSTVGESA